MALTKDTPRAYQLGDFNDLPVLTLTTVYEGAIVGLSSGYARGLVAGDPFAGIAYRKADNSVGASGAIKVTVYREGLISMPVTGASAVTNFGAAVFASADDTLTLTQGSNSYVGNVDRWVSGTTCIVQFSAMSASKYAAGTFTSVITGTLAATGNVALGNAVSDTIGFYNTTPTAQQTHIANAAAATATTVTEAFGTANGTFEDVTASFSQSILNNNFQECATQINALIVDVGLIRTALNAVLVRLEIIGIVAAA